jgi:hypothetical protein
VLRLYGRNSNAELSAKTSSNAKNIQHSLLGRLPELIKMQPNDSKAQATDFWVQYKYPTGVEGKAIAEKMNKMHFDLTSWGLSQVQVKPSFTVLDVGYGGGGTIRRLASHVPY